MGVKNRYFYVLDGVVNVKVGINDPPFLLGGLKLLPNFQKGDREEGGEGGGVDRISILRGRLREKSGVLKSEIFNDKKSLQAKIFFSVITKNISREILTKKLVTFKR